MVNAWCGQAVTILHREFICNDDVHDDVNDAMTSPLRVAVALTPEGVRYGHRKRNHTRRRKCARHRERNRKSHRKSNMKRTLEHKSHRGHMRKGASKRTRTGKSNRM